MTNQERGLIECLAQCIKDLSCMVPTNENQLLQARLGNVFSEADRVQDQLRFLD